MEQLNVLIRILEERMKANKDNVERFSDTNMADIVRGQLIEDRELIEVITEMIKEMDGAMVNNIELTKTHLSERTYTYEPKVIDTFVKTKATEIMLTPNEVADYLGCTAQSVRKWIKNGKMECTKYKKGMRTYIGITGADVAEFINRSGYVTSPFKVTE